MLLYMEFEPAGMCIFGFGGICVLTSLLSTILKFADTSACSEEEESYRPLVNSAL